MDPPVIYLATPSYLQEQEERHRLGLVHEASSDPYYAPGFAADVTYSAFLPGGALSTEDVADFLHWDNTTEDVAPRLLGASYRPGEVLLKTAFGEERHDDSWHNNEEGMFSVAAAHAAAEALARATAETVVAPAHQLQVPPGRLPWRNRGAAGRGTRSRVSSGVGFGWESDCSTADTTPEAGHSAEDLPTVGSRGHYSGVCKPCAFVFKPDQGGCKSGTLCQFCHLCGPGEKKRRKKVWQGMKQRQRGWQQDH